MTDDEIIDNFVDQTARLRFSVKGQGLRNLIRQHGHDPFRIIQFSCDQGDDVHVGLYLEDGSPVSVDYREHFKTRQGIQFTNWEVEVFQDRERELATKILLGDNSNFDRRVREYFDAELAQSDATLPRLGWGDCDWHTWASKSVDAILESASESIGTVTNDVQIRGDGAARFLTASFRDRGIELYVCDGNIIVDPSFGEELQGEQAFRSLEEAVSFASKWLTRGE